MNTSLQTSGDICPACGEGHLHQRIESQAVEYAGHSGQLPMQLSVCDHCGSEMADAAQALANKRAMIAFKKQADGLLTGAEIRAYRKCMKLKQETAAALFGGGKVAFCRYENDDISQTSAMDSLLRLCMGTSANLLNLARQKCVQLPPDTLSIIKNHSMDQLIKLAPVVQKLLDQELANKRKHSSIVASNDSAVWMNQQAGNVVETARWGRAA